MRTHEGFTDHWINQEKVINLLPAYGMKLGLSRQRGHFAVASLFAVSLRQTKRGGAYFLTATQSRFFSSTIFNVNKYCEG